jgi:hypothetical protein
VLDGGAVVWRDPVVAAAAGRGWPRTSSRSLATLRQARAPGLGPILGAEEGP